MSYLDHFYFDTEIFGQTIEDRAAEYRLRNQRYAAEEEQKKLQKNLGPVEAGKIIAQLGACLS